MKNSLVLIGQTLGKRKTDKQKLLFINTIAEPLISKGIQVQIHRNQNKKVKSNNIHIGDMDHAHTVFICPYDTGKALMIQKGFYYPCNNELNNHIQKNNLLLQTMIGIFAVIVIFFSANLFHSDMFLRIIGTLLDFTMILLLLYITISPSPSVNMNRNSAALTLAIELAKEKKLHTSFVLTDQSIDTKLGYIQISQWYKKDANQKTFIMLDALAKGEELYVIGRKNEPMLIPLAKQIQGTVLTLTEDEILNSPLALFKHAIMITRGKIDDTHILYVSPSQDHHDYQIDVDALEQLKENLENFIQQQE